MIHLRGRVVDPRADAYSTPAQRIVEPMLPMERAGRDDLGRDVYLTYAPRLLDLLGLEPPSSPFVGNS
jgi:hypothetical protein